jgi:hypothetical protein
VKFDLINLLVAVGAFALGIYTFAHQIVAERAAATVATDRMLFGSYTLGRDYEHLLLCVNALDPPFCEHATKLDDFAKLNPLARVLLASSVDWRTLVTPGQYENPYYSNYDELSATNLANAAMSAQYDNSTVATAFMLGRAIQDLIDLPNSRRTPIDASRYSISVTRNVNTLLSQLGTNYTAQDLPTGSPPDTKRVYRLHDCLEARWLPAASPSPAKTAASLSAATAAAAPSPDPCFP